MKLYQLVIKDVKNVLYDRKSLAILVFMPIILMSILGFSLKGMFGEETPDGFDPIEVAIVKEYNLEVEKKLFIDEFESSTMIEIESLDKDGMNLESILFEQFLEVDDIQNILHYQVATMEEVQKLIDSNSISAAIVLPEGYIYDGFVDLYTTGRNEIQVEILVNPEKSFTGQIAASIFESFTDNMNLQKARTGALIGDLVGKGRANAIESIMENMPESVSDGVDVTINELSINKQKSITSFQYYSVAIMCMFLLYAASFGSRAILSEKKEYTMARLSVSGVSASKIVISNFIRISLLSVVQSITMIVFSYFVLGVEWGNILSVVVGMIFLSITVGSFGMLLSVLTLITGTYSISNIFQFVVIQAMALIGGSFIPIEVLPDALSKFSFLSISGLGIKIYINAMYDLPLSANNQTLIILGIYSTVIVVLSFVLIHLNRKKVKAC